MKKYFFVNAIFIALIFSAAIFAQDENDLNFRFIRAAGNSNIALMESLLEQGADINTSGGWDVRSALLEAVSNRNKKMLEFLFDHGVDVQRSFGSYALANAAQDGDMEFVKILLEHGADVNGTMPLAEGSVLMSAASGGNAEIVKFLIESGAEVNYVDWDGNVALKYAGSAEIFKLLLENGADTSLVGDNFKEVVLCRAANEGAADLVELLIKEGADVNTKDKYERTPLIYASSPHVGPKEKPYAQIVKMLLESGADPNAKDNRDETALHWAENYKHNEEIVGILLDYGADINAKNAEGETPLDFARKHKYDEIEKLLLERGAKTTNEIAEETELATSDESTEKNSETESEFVPEAKSFKTKIFLFGKTPLPIAGACVALVVIILCILLARQKNAKKANEKDLH